MTRFSSIFLNIHNKQIYLQDTRLFRRYMKKITKGWFQKKWSKYLLVIIYQIFLS